MTEIEGYGLNKSFVFPIKKNIPVKCSSKPDAGDHFEYTNRAPVKIPCPNFNWL
jgi:hypothetical protein